MNNIKLHSCENCGFKFDYDNLEYDFIINCPCCRGIFLFVNNELNDFTYLEYVGLYLDVEIHEFNRNNHLFS